jgi:hypothetical protein
MGFTGGVQAAFANTRSGLVLVTGVGSGGGPHVKLFRMTDLETGAATQVGPGFMAYDPGFTGGARVAATADQAGDLLIVTGVGSGGGAHVKVFRVSNLSSGAAVQLRLRSRVPGRRERRRPLQGSQHQAAFPDVFPPGWDLAHPPVIRRLRARRPPAPRPGACRCRRGPDVRRETARPL